MNYEKERALAVKTVIKAGYLCRRIQKQYYPDQSQLKKDTSPVTVADLSVQAVISLDLEKAFPQDPIIAEEKLGGVKDYLKEMVLFQVKKNFPNLKADKIYSAIERCRHRGGSKGRFWALDPVDGTKGFIRGENYAIALALIEEGEVVVGVLGCPNLPIVVNDVNSPQGSLFIATKGEGAGMRSMADPMEKKIKVSPVSDSVSALFCESFAPDHSSHGKSTCIAEILGIKTPPLWIDGQGKYGLVARGDATIYLRLPTQRGYEEKIWDHAAGWLIVKEAGGEVTDLHGCSLDFSRGRTLNQNYGVVASNGKLHSQILLAIKKVYESS